MGDRVSGVPLPVLRGRGCRGGQWQRVRGRVDRGRGGGMHRTRVRIVEEALDANNTIAQANRADFDRACTTVVNCRSAPGGGKTTLLERALPRLDGVRVGVFEGDLPG